MPPPLRYFFGDAERLDLARFADLCAQQTEPTGYPLSQRLVDDIPVYDGRRSFALGRRPETRSRLLDEWHHGLLEGPGVLIIEGMFPDPGIVDAASEAFFSLIDEERAAGAKGDHFAAPGSNDRLWNAFQKHGLTAPDNFLAYYANPLLALISEAWLGPHYQITSQVNVVNPGGQAQRPHRDYHLGFQDDASVARYPLSMQTASQLLTLQGAIAHDDMPLETGPTQLLPYSQRYPEGYLGCRDPAFRDYFNAHARQLPLAKGDGLFFNPALFHAAGENRSRDRRRMANLLQVSSAFGRPMEAVDTRRLIDACYPHLIERHRNDRGSAEVQAFISAVAEGYAFPANLDLTPPTSGKPPDTQRQLLERALDQEWSPSTLSDALLGLEARRRP